MAYWCTGRLIPLKNVFEFDTTVILEREDSIAIRIWRCCVIIIISEFVLAAVDRGCC